MWSFCIFTFLILALFRHTHSAAYSSVLSLPLGVQSGRNVPLRPSETLRLHDIRLGLLEGGLEKCLLGGEETSWWRREKVTFWEKEEGGGEVQAEDEEGWQKQGEGLRLSRCCQSDTWCCIVVLLLLPVEIAGFLKESQDSQC